MYQSSWCHSTMNQLTQHSSASTEMYVVVICLQYNGQSPIHKWKHVTFYPCSGCVHVYCLLHVMPCCCHQNAVRVCVCVGCIEWERHRIHSMFMSSWPVRVPPHRMPCMHLAVRHVQCQQNRSRVYTTNDSCKFEKKYTADDPLSCTNKSFHSVT